MSDVLLFQTVDNGDINVDGGITELTGGFDTSFYLSLFGGDEDDDGSEGNTRTYWGNLMETGAAEKYVSRTQNILRGLPASPANLLRLEEAVKRDLQWYLDDGIATDVEAVATIPDFGRVEIAGSITVDSKKIPFRFTENWAAMSRGE